MSQLDERGFSPDFLLCKVGVALVVIALVGITLTLNDWTVRSAERQRLERLTDEIVNTIEKIDGLPGQGEIRCALLPIAGEFEVSMTGELNGNLQLVRVKVISGVQIERLLTPHTMVNNGGFWISVKNPSKIVAKKSDKITVELS